MAEGIRILDSQKNHIDTLPLTQEEPFTLETFGNLITAYRNQSKFLIIARVETEIPPKNPTDSPEARYFYYEANSLNKLLFRKFGNNSEYLFRLYALNPLTNTEIVGDVHYFLVDVEKEGPKSPIKILKSSLGQVLKPSGSATRSQLLNAKKVQSLNDSLLQRSLGKADIKIAEIVGPMLKEALAEQALRSASDVSGPKPSFSGPGSLNKSGIMLPAVQSLTMSINGGKLSKNSSDVDFKKFVNSTTATLPSTMHQARMDSNRRFLNDANMSLQARNIPSWSAEDIIGRNKSNTPEVNRSLATATSLQALRNKQQIPSTNVSPMNPLYEGDLPSWKVTIRRKSLQNEEAQKNTTAAVGNTTGELSSGLLASSLQNQREQQVSNISLVSNRSPATLAVEPATAVPVQSDSVLTPSTSAISPDTSSINSQAPAEKYKALFIGTDDDYLTHVSIRKIFSANGLTDDSSELFDIPIELLLNEGIIIPEMLESIGLTDDEYNLAIALGATPPEHARSTSRSRSPNTASETSTPSSSFPRNNEYSGITSSNVGLYKRSRCIHSKRNYFILLCLVLSSMGVWLWVPELYRLVVLAMVLSFFGILTLGLCLLGLKRLWRRSELDDVE